MYMVRPAAAEKLQVRPDQSSALVSFMRRFIYRQRHGLLYYRTTTPNLLLCSFSLIRSSLLAS